MLIVYSSSRYHVLQDPGGSHDPIRLHPATLALSRGELARAFQQQFSDAMAENDSADWLDAFLTGCDPLLTQPACRH